MTLNEQLPCPSPDCNSSDAYSIQDNGWGHCFSCGVNIPPTKSNQGPLMETKKIKKPLELTPLAEVYKPFPERGFTKETCQRYKIEVGGDDKNFEAKYPMFDPDSGELVAKRVRGPNKSFFTEGELSKAGLYGQSFFPPGSAKYITVVEGQDDAAAAYQAMGSKYPVVSIHSASTAERDVRKSFEYLNSFDNIVFCFDNDEPGKKAAKAVSNAGFSLGKVKVLTLRKHKDANEYLKAGDVEAFVREWWQAPIHRPDGLKMGSELFPEIMDRKEHFTTMYPFHGLNSLTYGIRLSEFVVFTADTGIGKTLVLKHIEHKLLTDPEVKEKGYGVGFLHLEEPNGDTALGLLSIHNKVPYHIPDVERPEKDLRKAYDEVLNNDRVVIWDHFGSNSVDAIIDKIRHMAALGCKYIVLDHLSIIVSDQAGDERKMLDEIATKIKTLTMELDIAVLSVIHTNRQGLIRGTAGVEQLANIVIRLQRDKTEADEWRRNITKISVEKNRFCGFTGPAAYLWYNKETGCLLELDEEEAKRFEEGAGQRDDGGW